MALRADACFLEPATMRTLLAVVSILALAGCAKQPIQAAGVYRLSMAEKTMVLEVRTGGEYVLQVDGVGRNTDEIRGRWEDERGAKPGPDLSFHGIVWRGTEPEAGQAIWAASFGRNADICLDAEGLSCFSKDDAA